MFAATAGASAGPSAAGSDATADPPTETMPSPIAVTTDGTTVVLAVVRCLDEAAGDALLGAAAQAVDTGSSRIDIDLRALQSYTDAGAQALVSCRALGARLAEGLHYRTGRGPGREALLAAYTDADTP
jgi:hypothetical protein